MQRFKAAAPRCWRLLASLRSSSLCTTCSARNFRFYKEKLLGLGEKDCKRFVDTCNQFFLNLSCVSWTAAGMMPEIIKLYDKKSFYIQKYGYYSPFSVSASPATLPMMRAGRPSRRARSAICSATPGAAAST